MMRRIWSWSLPLAAVALGGCSIGGGLGIPGFGGNETGQFNASVSASVGQYAILDLASGQVEVATVVPNLASDNAYRTSKMVFRSIDASVATIGASGGIGDQSDETRSSVSVNRYWLGVFEVTQAQWRTLSGGSEPWTAAPAALLGPAATSAATKDQTPAVEISSVSAASVAGSAGTRMGHALALPTPAQWEVACRAGSTGSYSWGDSLDESVMRAHAVVSEVRDSVDGARPVGGRSANAFGFYDMHGNAWEFTSDGVLRGGSWRDTVTQARCANRGSSLDSRSSHVLVGFRLVLTP